MKNTTGFNPWPFVLRNEGTVDINVTINASQLWYGTGATGTSAYYRFQSAENETGSVYNTTADIGDLRSITNIPTLDKTSGLFITSDNSLSKNELICMLY